MKNKHIRKLLLVVFATLIWNECYCAEKVQEENPKALAEKTGTSVKTPGWIVQNGLDTCGIESIKPVQKSYLEVLNIFNIAKQELQKESVDLEGLNEEVVQFIRLIENQFATTGTKSYYSTSHDIEIKPDFDARERYVRSSQKMYCLKRFADGMVIQEMNSLLGKWGVFEARLRVNIEKQQKTSQQLEIDAERRLFLAFKEYIEGPTLTKIDELKKLRSSASGATLGNINDKIKRLQQRLDDFKKRVEAIDPKNPKESNKDIKKLLSDAKNNISILTKVRSIIASKEKYMNKKMESTLIKNKEAFSKYQETTATLKTFVQKLRYIQEDFLEMVALSSQIGLSQEETQILLRVQERELLKIINFREKICKKVEASIF